MESLQAFPIKNGKLKVTLISKFEKLSNYIWYYIVSINL